MTPSPAQTAEDYVDAYLAKTYSICTTHEWRAALIEWTKARDAQLRAAVLMEAADVLQAKADEHGKFVSGEKEPVALPVERHADFQHTFAYAAGMVRALSAPAGKVE